MFLETNKQKKNPHNQKTIPPQKKQNNKPNNLFSDQSKEKL